MFAVVFCAAIVFACAQSAVLPVGDFENEVNEIEGWARGNVDKAEELMHKGANNVVVWAKKELDTAQSWTKQIVKDAEGRVLTKLIHREEYVRIPVPKFTGDKCVCTHQTCGCCVHAEEPDIHLNSTVCINVTYLSEDYGVSFTVTLNNHTLYNETVSVRNPPPVCVGFPYVKELADMCVRLYDIDAKSHSFHACARVEARMKYVMVAHYDLGCFTIGSSSVGDSKKANSMGNSHPSVVLI